MKKIASEAEKLRKKKFSRSAMGIFLIFLMVFSTASFAFIDYSNEDSSVQERITYQGTEFSSDGYFWYFTIGGNQFATLYNPQELAAEGITSPLDYSLSRYTNQPLYYVGDGEGLGEIDRNIRFLLLRTSRACLTGTICEGNFPIKDCNDHIIVFKESVSPSIYSENNCVFIVAPRASLAKYTDAFLFDLFDV